MLHGEPNCFRKIFENRLLAVVQNLWCVEILNLWGAARPGSIWSAQKFTECQKLAVTPKLNISLKGANSMQTDI